MVNPNWSVSSAVSAEVLNSNKTWPASANRVKWSLIVTFAGIDALMHAVGDAAATLIVRTDQVGSVEAQPAEQVHPKKPAVRSTVGDVDPIHTGRLALRVMVATPSDVTSAPPSDVVKSISRAVSVEPASGAYGVAAAVKSDAEVSVIM